MESYSPKSKHSIISKLIDTEGGYVDHQLDSGGKTRWGITQKRARFHGYRGHMETLSYGFAFSIYERDEWQWVSCDELLKIDRQLCEIIFNFAVHSGAHRPSIYLQRILNALNRRGKLYEDIKADGVIGAKTLAALKRYTQRRDIEVLKTAFLCLQGTFYLRLAENRENQEEFIYGWLKNRLLF
jgi:lysozyme family protein